jgi:hypothetical protein
LLDHEQHKQLEYRVTSVPFFSITEPIWIANSNIGARISACGYWIDGSIREIIAKNKAAVLPVPDWDCVMIFPSEEDCLDYCISEINLTYWVNCLINEVEQ